MFSYLRVALVASAMLSMGFALLVKAGAAESVSEQAFADSYQAIMGPAMPQNPIAALIERRRRHAAFCKLLSATPRFAAWHATVFNLEVDSAGNGYVMFKVHDGAAFEAKIPVGSPLYTAARNLSLDDDVIVSGALPAVDCNANFPLIWVVLTTLEDTQLPDWTARLSEDQRDAFGKWLAGCMPTLPASGDSVTMALRLDRTGHVLSAASVPQIGDLTPLQHCGPVPDSANLPSAFELTIRLAQQ